MVVKTHPLSTTFDPPALLLRIAFAHGFSFALFIYAAQQARLSGEDEARLRGR